MRRLILFRHAKAEARAPGQEDIDRPLAERGRADAAAMARLAVGRGLIPDLALVSPALRTRQTWLLAHPALGEVIAEVRDGLYNATAEEIMAEVALVDAAVESVMVVGHNPGLHELAVNLLVEGGAAAADVERVAARFPTATLAAFLFDDNGRAAFDGVFHPRGPGAG